MREIEIIPEVCDELGLLILMKLWPKNWEEQFGRTKKNVEEENGKGGTQ